MAQYTEKIFAEDSWQTEGRTSTFPIRKEQITALAYYDFYNQGTTNGIPIQYNALHFQFPNSQKYGKKRLVGGSLSLYIRARKQSASGYLPGGDFIHQMADGSLTYFTRNQYYLNGEKYAIDALPLNQYFDVEWFQGTKLSVQSGVTSSMWKGETYTSEASFTVDSHLGSNPPYATLLFEDVLPYVEKAFPTEGFIDEKKKNTFSWEFGYENIRNDLPIYGYTYPVSEKISQASAKFRWRPFGQSEYTEIQIEGNTQSVTIPAGTFSTEQIQWQVVVTSDDGIEGTPSEWFTLTTVDSACSAKAVSPENTVVDGSFPVEFKWEHIIDTGSDQSKYELEYSQDNGLKWIPLQSESTKNTFATIPANTLPAGSLLWKVRTYNSDGVAGSWSQPVQFVVRAAPLAPSISSITAQARPVVRWQATGQQAFEVQVLSGDQMIYTTGPQAGTQKEKKIPVYLAPGSYTVRIQICNSYNLPSPWGTGSVQVPDKAISSPTMILTNSPGFVEIQGIGSNFQQFYLLRDGIPIARSEMGRFEDYAVSAGFHQYQIRAITAEDEFADSAPEEIEVRLPFAMVAPVSDLTSWVPMIYRRNASPSWSENLQTVGQPIYAAGRRLPFFETAEFFSNSLSFVYSYRTREEYEKMKALLLGGQTVRYRGKDGASYWMAITGLQTNADYLSRDFTLSAQEVDYREEIEYEE